MIVEFARRAVRVELSRLGAAWNVGCVLARARGAVVAARVRAWLATHWDPL